LTFAVRDDGVGFDPIAKGYGTGIQGMADRLAALGGDFRVTSSAGEGTLIEGRVPIDIGPESGSFDHGDPSGME
jgi:signal transduction histidine kinase